MVPAGIDGAEEWRVGTASEACSSMNSPAWLKPRLHKGSARSQTEAVQHDATLCASMQLVKVSLMLIGAAAQGTPAMVAGWASVP